MAEPIQQFIQNYMGFQQFLESQKQAVAQEALMNRQMENAEIQNFVTLASKVQDPKELGSLAQFFGERTGNPEVFSSLALNIAPSLETQQAGMTARGAAALSPEEEAAAGRSAVLRMAAGQTAGEFITDQIQAGRDPMDILEAIRIGEGQELSAGQEAQLSESQADRELRETLGVGQLELGRAGFRLDDRRFIHQAGLDRAQFELLKREADREDLAAQMERLQGAGYLSMSTKELNDAAQAAWDDVNTAKNRGEEDAARQRYNDINVALAQKVGRPDALLMQPNPAWWTFGIGRGTEMFEQPLQADSTKGGR